MEGQKVFIVALSKPWPAWSIAPGPGRRLQVAMSSRSTTSPESWRESIDQPRIVRLNASSDASPALWGFGLGDFGDPQVVGRREWSLGCTGSSMVTTLRRRLIQVVHAADPRLPMTRHVEGVALLSRDAP